MNIRVSTILLAGLLALAANDSPAEQPGTCVSGEEAQLMRSINDYRAANGKASVAWSKSLTTVAQWHVLDATTNAATVFTDSCNLHSWSAWQPSLWNAVCYTADHANASLMWGKPKEITKNIYRANGYEIGGRGYTSVADVLAGWQGSPGHNAVLLSQGNWANLTFKAMGAGVDSVSRVYYVWFSTDADPQGEMALCSPPVFSGGFESEP